MTEQLYRNPIQRDGDFADPFVLRHDGRYYLYCTNPDVRCWSSDDLVDWRLEGPTIADDEFPGLVPFAPEVVYADGFFYMYTSPSGLGHFVLRAESPTGPFTKVTGNVGHAIDGNVFIDDDGRWYFYWAGDEGIWGCQMTSPTEFGDAVLTGVHMNGWTEGPFVSKRDGVYFMTLTGNHYLSTGYRIDAAASDHPLRGWQADSLNPILVETEGARVGLGHSSSVHGPDLVSTYLVYHNINPDRSRDLDIDRQVWDGRSIRVLGPTKSAPVPSQPDVVSRGGCRLPVGEVFTAEVNLTALPAADAGIAIGAPGSPTLTVRIDPAGRVVRARQGDTELASAPLPASFEYEALHCWRLEADGRQLRVLVDGRLQFTVPCTSSAGSVLDAVGDVRIGHCAMTGTSPAAADAAAVVPIPGAFRAVLSVESALSRRIHVQTPGEFAVYVAGDVEWAGTASVAVDDGPPLELQPRGVGVRSANIALLETTSRLTLRGLEGPAVVTVAAAPGSDAVRIAKATTSGWGKEILDPSTRDDVAVSATVRFNPGVSAGHADVLLRASQLSEGGEGDDTRLGIDFLRGYSVQLHADRVVFARHAYDERVLAEHLGPIDPSVAHALEIRATGGRFIVELDGAVVIDAVDPMPHHFGHIGIRTAGADLHLEDAHIDPNSTGPH